MALAYTYDAINTAIFLPSGGSRRLRQTLVDALDVRPGHRVLELGCGTGQVTEILLRSGAEVIAVDALPGMLSGARRRAPDAAYIEGDLLAADVGEGFDRVVLSFVLHGFDGAGRSEVLRRSAEALGPAGQVGILDWSLPNGARRARVWRRFLLALEPSPTVEEVLAGAIAAELLDTGMRVLKASPVAGGRARLFVAQPGNTG